MLLEDRWLVVVLHSGFTGFAGFTGLGLIRLEPTLRYGGAYQNSAVRSEGQEISCSQKLEEEILLRVRVSERLSLTWWLSVGVWAGEGGGGGKKNPAQHSVLAVFLG